MGAALDKLGAEECERIFGQLVELTGKQTGSAIGGRCPWHDEKTTGGFWYYPEKDIAKCYGCGEAGDLVDVFCAVEGFQEKTREGFVAFMERFGRGRYTASVKREKGSSDWRPREAAGAEADWVIQAAAWVEKCAARLTDADYDQLETWGVSRAAAARFRIGAQPEDRFVPFTKWGLPYAENANGRERCIHLPAGLVFPVFSVSGELRRVKVRLSAPKPDEPKYKAVVGGSTCYAICGASDLRVWVVVETERDAMMLAEELRLYGIGAMAVGSAQVAPDAEAHEILRRADCVLNALDSDEAGARASWGFDPDAGKFFWNLTYPHAVRWPVPQNLGKDPADLVGKVSVVDWVLAGLPGHVRRVCVSRMQKAFVQAGNEEMF